MAMENETQSLLRLRPKEWQNRKLCVLAGIVIFFVLLCVAVSVTFGCIYWQRNHNPVHLRDVLPKSFDVTFDVQIKNLSLSESTNDVTVIWEVEPNDQRFQRNSVDMSGNESIFTIVRILDNRAVVSYTLENKTSFQCATDLKIFHWFSILHLMMTATESKDTHENCPGKVWTVPYNGKIVSICFKESRITSIEYDDSVAESQEWIVPSRSSIKMPQNAPECPVKYPHLSLMHIIQQTQNNERIESKIINVRSAIKAAELLSRKDAFVRSTKSDCLFVHGIGERTPKSGFKTLTAFPDYWGDIHKHTPQCSSHKFVQFNTIDNGWDSPDLHKMFCEFATGLQTGGLISNKIIFSHSMGNNIVAAALHSKSCTLDKASSQWFSVSAPWRGSKVVDKLKRLCAGRFSTAIITYILKHTKFCTKDGNMSPAYKTLAPSYRSKTGITYDDLVSVAREYVDGALCGTSPWGMGLNLPFSGALEFVQSYSNLETPNDGVVAKVSCGIFGTTFRTSYKSKFFLGAINHEESSAKFGCRGNLCLWYKHL